MINSNINASSVNRVNAKVELYSGSTLVETCTCNDRLQDFTVERVGQNNKFFGFGIFHKVTINLIDLERNLTVTEANTFKIKIGYGDQFVQPYPTFYTNKVTRDETTNTITVVAYCKLATKASTHTVNEIVAPYTIREFTSAAAALLGIESVEFQGINAAETCLDTYYEKGGNFEGTEGLSEALDQIAEVTQTIYFLNHEDKLIFKRLDRDGLPALTISKNDYYDLETGEIRRLSTIVDTNELGNSTSVGNVTGVIQYVRDNPFWELRDDIQVLLTNAYAAIGGISAAPFHCTWDGNFLLEIGDKIALSAEDNSTITSFILNDTIYYDSTLEETTQFIHTGEEETASNPVSLGERLKQTYAKVDKQNKQIELVASEAAENKNNIASLSITVDGIDLSVKELNTKTETIETNLSTLNTDLTTLSGTVATNTTGIGELKVTTESINASVSSLETTTTNLATKDGELEESITTNATAIGELQVSTESISASVGELQTTTDNLTGEVTTNKENIAALQITTDGISTSVSSLEESTNSKLDGLNKGFESLTQEVSTKVTANDIEVAITEERQKGAEKVTTSTGFTFDSEGLTITKSDSAISTNIDEDGLSVYKYNEEVLTADNTGVKAQNLHATTYLIIGNNTYFADFTEGSTPRAGCFWTGK